MKKFILPTLLAFLIGAPSAEAQFSRMAATIVKKGASMVWSKVAREEAAMVWRSFEKKALTTAVKPSIVRTITPKPAMLRPMVKPSINPWEIHPKYKPVVKTATKLGKKYVKEEAKSHLREEREKERNKKQ